MLGECRECGSKISTNAVSCPQCGQPDPFFSQGLAALKTNLKEMALDARNEQEILCPVCDGGGLLYRYVEKRYHPGDGDYSYPSVHSNYWSNRSGEDPERFGRYRNSVQCGTCKGSGKTTRKSLQYSGCNKPSPWLR